MTLSLKEIAQGCLGLRPPISVVHKIFECWFAPPQRPLSLKRQLELMEGPGFNINIFLVGRDYFNEGDLREIDYAVQIAREIYANVNLCIRGICWQQISSADAGDYLVIDNDSEAISLTDDWNGPSGNLDVFIVRNSWPHSKPGFVALGLSAVKGPCPHTDEDEMTGSVVSLGGDENETGIILAHEIGHYLGNEHDEADPNNFMYWVTNGSNTGITEEQGKTMKSHCYVEDIC